ncbi:MAG TPA: class I SAM-dependent methyltransferase [Planctomycetaceae bacterium]|nr:class I SAM-dependent methyltransferase [Planctomycetaceae bacterium]
MATVTEAQIRPTELMARKAHCVDADRDFLLERRSRWIDVPCPACGGSSHAVYGEKQGFRYVTCDDCRTVYTNPRPPVDLLHEFYSQSANYAFWNEHIFPATEEVRRERIFRPRAERLAEFCRRFGISGGTFLEVGAAFGTFCEEVRSSGTFDELIALEPTPGLAETCRRRGFTTWETFVESIEATDFARTVAAFEVIEHLFDPAEFLDACRRVLEPGGLVVLSCPNVMGFGVATLGTASGSFDHEHLNYFHPRSLASLLDRRGFDVLEVQTPGQLDVDLVRTAVRERKLDLSDQPLLQQIVVDEHERLGGPFQQFLADHCLSSHLWIVGRKRSA